MTDDEKLLSYLESFMTEERKAKFLAVLSNRTYHFTVAIEDVFQAHNTSAVIRTCEVFGIQEAHLIEARFGKKLDRKIAMGAQKWVDVYRHNNAIECMQALRQQGYKIIATSPHHDSCLLDEFDIGQKAAFFFGTELEGLSEEVMQQADGFLKIPMVGFTESLNISVSAAIILQQLSVKLRASNVAWQLTPEQVLQKRIDWAKKSVRSPQSLLKRFEEG